MKEHVSDKYLLACDYREALPLLQRALMCVCNYNVFSKLGSTHSFVVKECSV